MKELIQDHKDYEVEIIVEQQQKKEIKLIGRQRKIPGLTLWEYNTETFILKPATFKKQDVELKTLSHSNEAIQKRSNVEVNEKCVYFQALNKNNAARKITKRYKDFS